MPLGSIPSKIFEPVRQIVHRLLIDALLFATQWARTFSPRSCQQIGNDALVGLRRRRIKDAPDRWAGGLGVLRTARLAA